MPGTYTTQTWTPIVGRPYEYKAFTPTSLRVRLPDRWSPEVRKLADEALEMLASLPAQQALGGLSVHLGRAEAGGSSMIEGHYVGARRLFEIQFDPTETVDRTALPVFDNWQLMERVRSGVALSLDELRMWHNTLMAHDLRARPGSFRDTQNWIGGDVYGPNRATFVPPPPEAVPGLLDDLVDYAVTTLDHPIVKAAALHTQFETIHPFGDGNGRVGRALIHWSLRASAPSVPPLALIWYSHGDRYYGALDAWRTLRDPEPWVAYFSQSIIDAVTAAHTLLGHLEQLQKDWFEATAARAGSLKRALLDDLAINPIVDIASATKRYGATPSRFSRTARELVAAGVLTETNLPRRRRGKPPKVYEARGVFDILNAFVEEYRTNA